MIILNTLEKKKNSKYILPSSVLKLNDLHHTKYPYISLFPDRLVSAYRDKIAGDKGYYKEKIWPAILGKYRKGTTNKTMADNPQPTFREFALFASDEVLQCLGGAEPSCIMAINVHWQPHHDRCAPCNIKYDVIVKVSLNRSDGGS